MNTPLRAYADAFVRAIPSGTDAVKEFTVCAEGITTTPQLRAFLNDPSVPITTRRDALKTAFPTAAQETINFFTLLAAEEQIDRLEDLKRHVRMASAANEGKRHAEVASASPLTSADRKRITSALSQRLNADILLEETSDPSLLAGFRITSDGWTFDASLKGKLDRLQHALTL